MRNILFVIAALIIFAFASCYVGVEGRHRRHRATLEIHTSNNLNQSDSLQMPAMSTVDKGDSLSTHGDPGTVK